MLPLDRSLVSAEISTSLHDTLHWLPLPQRALFRSALMAFDCVRGQEPGYFNGVVTPVHTLQLGPDCDLQAKVTWSSRAGFLEVRENGKKSGNLSGQGKIRGKYFFSEKSGKMKNCCHQMRDF